VGFVAGSFIRGEPINGTQSQSVDPFIPGQIRFGTGGPATPQGLAASVEAAGDGGGAGAGGDARDVRLAWSNASTYEKVRIERNGVLVAEVDGSSTEFRDVRVPGGVYTYKVSGAAGGRTSFPASTFLSTASPPGAFLRGDANADGKITIVDPVATLTFLFLGGAPLACEDGADANDDGVLTLTDAITTLSYLFLGGAVIKAPGTKFPWFDPTTDGLGCGG
jgi:hypothetical protein